MLSTRDPLQNKGHIQTKSEGLEKNIYIFHANGDQCTSPEHLSHASSLGW